MKPPLIRDFKAMIERQYRAFGLEGIRMEQERATDPRFPPIAENYYARMQKKEEKARIAAEKQRARLAALAEKERARLAALAEKDPYFIDPITGKEREVNLSVRVYSGKTVGNFVGKAAIGIPSMEAWAKFYAKQHKTEVTILDCKVTGTYKKIFRENGKV